MLSADNLCEQFGHSTGLTICQALTGSLPLDTQNVFLKGFFQKVDFEKKNSRQHKCMQNFPACNEKQVIHEPAHVILILINLVGDQ